MKKSGSHTKSETEDLFAVIAILMKHELVTLDGIYPHVSSLDYNDSHTANTVISAPLILNCFILDECKVFTSAREED